MAKKQSSKKGVAKLVKITKVAKKIYREDKKSNMTWQQAMKKAAKKV